MKEKSQVKNKKAPEAEVQAEETVVQETPEVAAEQVEATPETPNQEIDALAEKPQGYFADDVPEDFREKAYVHKLATGLSLGGLCLSVVSLFVFRFLSIPGILLGVAALVLEIIKERKQKLYDSQAFFYSVAAIALGILGVILWIIK